VLFYSELDPQRWELRKLEIWTDGRVGFADSTEATAETALGDASVPPLDEIACDRQFSPTAITAVEFEAIWVRRRARLTSAEVEALLARFPAGRP
jgi:hypothetical protein